MLNRAKEEEFKSLEFMRVKEANIHTREFKLNAGLSLRKKERKRQKMKKQMYSIMYFVYLYLLYYTVSVSSLRNSNYHV